MTISKRNKAKLYRAAAKEFESGGFTWMTGRMGSIEQFSHCAVGGLHHTAVKLGLETEFIHGYLTINEAKRRPWRDAEVECSVYFKLAPSARSEAARSVPGIDWAVEFNDSCASGAKDVVRFLRRCASALEHGGRV